MIILQLVVPVMSLFSQTINYNELSTTGTSGQYQKYVSKTGEIYSVGDQITIADPSRSSGTFAYVKKVDSTGELTTANSKASGYTGAIKRIRLTGNSRTGTFISFIVQGPNASYNYVIYIENALEKKEVKPKG